MKTKTTMEYMSPALDMYELISESPIALSIADANALAVRDAFIDDWGTL